MEFITLHTIFENQSALNDISRILGIPASDFNHDEGNNYLNEQFPKSLDKQVQSLFELRIIQGWTFCNFWNHSVGKLDGIYLSHLNLDGMGFIEMNLAGADFSHSSLVRTYLRAANLENANFEHANLESAYLMNANLKGSNLNQANLKNAQMSGCII